MISNSSRHLLAALVVAGVLPDLTARAAPALGHVYAWMPGYNVDGRGVPNLYSNVAGGRMGMLTIELPDDYDAVQIGVSNGGATGWGVDRIVAAPSASYGGDGVTGSAAYDLDGAPLDQMLPVSFSRGGANSQPGHDPATMSLPLLAATRSGAKLAFAALVSAPAYGSITPSVGWSVADGLGCVAANTTITAISAATVTLSAPVAGPGCLAGQAIYFSSAALGPLSQAVPAGPGASLESLTFSDWLAMDSLPRIDGGYTIGAAISGPGIAAGTRLASMGYDQLTLSRPLDTGLPAGSALQLSWSPAAASAIPAGSTSLPVADTSGISPGQSVADGNTLPTHVVSVAGGQVRIDTPTAAKIDAGTPIAFSNPAWTTLAAKAGDIVVQVPSTSARKLLHLRFFLTPKLTPSFRKPACAPDAVLHNVECETPLGIAPVWSTAGGQTNGVAIDGVDFVSAIGAGAGGAVNEGSYPTFFIRFKGRHAGSTLLGCGNFQLSGATGSVSGEASFANISAAAAQAAHPDTPISVVNTATRLNTQVNYANCQTWMNAISPGIVLFQDYSNHNGGTVAQFAARVATLANQVLGYGGQPVIYLGYDEGSSQVGQMVVNGATVASRFVPLLDGINPGQAGTGLLVQGPGVAPGTTASAVAGDWSIELSKPATVPAGSVLNFGYEVAADHGTAITLAYPSSETIGKVAVTGNNVPPKTNIHVTHGSTAATLSRSASLTSGTLLTLSQPVVDTPLSYYGAAVYYRTLTNQPWAALQIDGPIAVSTGTLHNGPLCNGCTTQGRYANDYGNSLIAAALTPVLEHLTGH